MGYEMVARAQRMADQIEANPGCDTFTENDDCVGLRWELRNLIENMELVRGYYDFYGYAWF